MNILYYCDEYPPAKTGGIGRVTQTYAEALVKRGHNVVVVGYYPYNDALNEYEIQNGVHVYRYNLGLRNSYLKNLLYLILYKIGISKIIIQKELFYVERNITSLIEEYDIDLIELPDYYYYNSFASDLDYLNFKIPTVARIHGCASFIRKLKNKNYSYIKINDTKHLDRCDYASAVSRYSMDFIKKEFPNNTFKIENIIYNSVDDTFLSPPNKKESNKSILFIGKLIETKGCYSAIKAFNIIADKYPEIQFRLIGNGDMAQAKSFINENIKNRITFLGFCDKKKVIEEIDNSLLVCIPTYYETLGMVALEVMARGKALIFTERTSGPEIINDGIDGYLVNPENIDQIVLRLEDLLKNKLLCEEFGTKGRAKIIENFTSTKIIKELETFYLKVVNDNEY